jgi:uncharacterized protein YkwD
MGHPRRSGITVGAVLLLMLLTIGAWAGLAVEAASWAYLPLISRPPLPTATATAVSPTATATAVSPTPTRTPTPTATPQPSLADEVIALTNQQRAYYGLPPLQRVQTLMNAAQGHSQDMASNDFLGHTGSDGSDGGQRMTRAGYPWIAWGENVAAGYPTAAEVVQQWMNSPGHRANILDPGFRDIGAGHAYGPWSYYGHYWTQVIGARR